MKPPGRIVEVLRVVPSKIRGSTMSSQQVLVDVLREISHITNTPPQRRSANPGIWSHSVWNSPPPGSDPETEKPKSEWIGRGAVVDTTADSTLYSTC